MRCDMAIKGVTTSIVIVDLWEITVGYYGNLAILTLNCLRRIGLELAVGGWCGVSPFSG